ncbi:hypothetical protein [Streptomyces aidingensis]|uniref:Uncharacterized protein n=1 Tax=Streptomyces aidingensis TaxID=910347 RepID=A0A1I1PTC6_9ACTN|nr:hypothetical protein [Streptomyces aidingensis]SFD13151.1 hypothetical protein SAMN05421773_11041 [Streptomyces aidingensis]
MTTAARYRKKPVEIEAIHFDGSNASVLAVMHFVNAGHGTREIKIHAAEDPAKTHITIPTLEGDMRATAGDWIVRGVKGELYPVKPDIFEATYEAATGPDPAGHGPLWRLLDWSFWGAGMGDTFREPLADAMLAAIPAETIAQAEAVMAEFIERRQIKKTGVTRYQEQRDELERLRAALAARPDPATALRQAIEVARATGDRLRARGYEDRAWGAYGVMEELGRRLADGAEPAAAPDGDTQPCGHDDYHDPHPWPDKPHTWCPGHTSGDGGA